MTVGEFLVWVLTIIFRFLLSYFIFNIFIFIDKLIFVYISYKYLSIIMI